MAEGDTPAGPPAGGGGGNASFNTATVGIARVGRVEILDPRTGQPREPGNDLVDQIRALGDRLDTSLGTMIAEIKNMNRGTTTPGRDTSAHERRSERTDKEQTEFLKKMEKNSELLTEIAEKMNKAMTDEKNAKKDSDKEILDAIQQGFAGMHKGPMSGLKYYVDAHKTMMRTFIEKMRETSAEILRDQNKVFQKERAKLWTADQIAQLNAKGSGPNRPTGQTTGQITKMAVGTYVRQRWTEEQYANMERLTLHVDKAIFSLFSFTNTIDYATKKWKQFTDVAGSGVDGFFSFFLSDFAKLWTAGDALGETFNQIRISAKAGFATSDSQLFIAGRSLQEASVELRKLRTGTQNAGFNTDAFMGFRDANEILTEMLTQMKRAGILGQMDDAQRNHYLAEQLKSAQLTAENTGLTVKEVVKMNAEANKKIALMNAGGMISDQNKGMWDAAKSRFAATNPEMMNRLLEMQGSGGIEQWAAKNKEMASAMIADGTFDAFRNALKMMNSGTTDFAGTNKAIEQMMIDAARASHAKTQAGGSNIAGAVTSPNAPILADINQLAEFRNKNKPGEGDPIMAAVNSTADFFSNSFVWDAFKALAGLPMGLVTANALLTIIAANTGGFGALGGLLKGGGKLLGKGAGMVANLGGKALGLGASALGGLGSLFSLGTPAAAAGATAAGAAGTTAAGVAGGGILGGLMKGAGKFLLKGLPLLGGIAGGAIDKAAGGSLLSAILSGGASGAAIGGIGGAFAGGIGAIPGAALGALGGAITGAIGYGLADWFGAGGDKTTTSPSQQGPTPPSYTSRNSDQMSAMSRGMFERMDVQIEKLTELITVVKDSNKAIVMNANMVRQTGGNSASVNDGGTFLGAISKLWG